MRSPFYQIGTNVRPIKRKSRDTSESFLFFLNLWFDHERANDERMKSYNNRSNGGNQNISLVRIRWTVGGSFLLFLNIKRSCWAHRWRIMKWNGEWSCHYSYSYSYRPISIPLVEWFLQPCLPVPLSLLLLSSTSPSTSSTTTTMLCAASLHT